MSPLQSLRGLQVPLSLAEASAHHPALTPSERWTEAGTKRLFPTIVIQAVRLLCAFHTSEGSTNPPPPLRVILPSHSPSRTPPGRTHNYAPTRTHSCTQRFSVTRDVTFQYFSHCHKKCIQTRHPAVWSVCSHHICTSPSYLLTGSLCSFFFARLLRWSTIVASRPRETGTRVSEYNFTHRFRHMLSRPGLPLPPSPHHPRS